MNRHQKDGRLTPERRRWVEWMVRRYVRRAYPNDVVVHRHLINSIVRSVELSLGRDGEVAYRWEGGGDDGVDVGAEGHDEIVGEKKIIPAAKGVLQIR